MCVRSYTIYNFNQIFLYKPLSYRRDLEIVNWQGKSLFNNFSLQRFLKKNESNKKNRVNMPIIGHVPMNEHHHIFF